MWWVERLSLLLEESGAANTRLLKYVLSRAMLMYNAITVEYVCVWTHFFYYPQVKNKPCVHWAYAFFLELATVANTYGNYFSLIYNVNTFLTLVQIVYIFLLAYFITTASWKPPTLFALYVWPMRKQICSSRSFDLASRNTGFKCHICWSPGLMILDNSSA